MAELLWESDISNSTTRFWAQVDKTDACWNWTGSLVNNGYGRATHGGKQTLAHRISYEMSGAVIPEGMFIDHQCHNRACVRPGHLRVVSRKENSENVVGAYSNSKSGVRGVMANNGRWKGTVRHNKKLHYVGTYDTIEEADAAVTAKRLELFTHNDSDRAA